MIGLAELRLEAEDAAGALAAAKQGLKFVFDRSKVSRQPWLVPEAEEQSALEQLRLLCACDPVCVW